MKKEPRLNDFWILNTRKDAWIAEQDLIISNSVQESPWKVNARIIDRPSPRGSHSAAFVEGAIFIFGGYGGNGYSRKDFNDLFALCTKTWRWFQLDTKGDLPKPKSGHKSVYFDGKFYVMGGWNAVETLDDVYILDIETMTWSRADSACGPESWGDVVGILLR